jgi:uncharacterized damage-inducible protein DinB
MEEEQKVTRATIAEARVFESWQAYQEALKRAIAPLTDEQMRSRPVPGMRSPGELVQHIVFGRAVWVRHVLGEKAAELEPMLHWNDADDPPHTAAEILHGLDATWRLITDYLMRGSATDAVSDEDVTGLQTIWGLLDHDLPHAGELSLLLGTSGLPGVEID